VGEASKAWVGVDAGGSHTELALGLDSPGPLLRVEGPGIFLGREPDRATETILGLLEQALARHDATLELRAFVVGAAGAGRESACAALREGLRGAHPHPRIVSDFEIAHASAFPSGPGLLLGAGTGSYAVGRDGAGELVRVGGWGPVLSDEGSGYHLALQALRRATEELDGRAPATELSASLLGAAGCPDLDALVTWSVQASRSDLAALAREVSSLAAAGQPEACALVEGAAAALLKLVRGLAARLGEETIPVALAGGLLAPGTPLRAALARRLVDEPGTELHEGSLDPVLGALALAGWPGA